MKRFVTTMLLLLPTLMLAQVDFSLNQWGRIRLIDDGGTRHLDRFSFDFADNQDNVYMYKDVGITLPYIPPAPRTPAVADSEMVFTICYFNGADTIAFVEHEVYWWENKNFLIVSFEISDYTGADQDGYFSMEVIPQIDQAYGDEFVDYDATNEMGYIFKTSSYVGTKLLSQAPYSFRAAQYSDYSQGNVFPDTALWTQITEPANSTFPFSPGSDGSACFLNAGDFTIPANGSVKLYAALAFGSSLGDLQTHMTEAQNVYDQSFVSISPESENIPDGFSLGANYPNPFNPSTTIPFALPAAADVRIEIFNVLGQPVRTLLDEKRAAGEHMITWNGRDNNGRAVESGLYLYRVRVSDANGTASQVRKMLLTK